MIDFDKLVISPCQAVFGEICQFLPSTGGIASVTGIFNEAYQPLTPLGDLGREIGFQADITSSEPMLGVRLALFSQTPQQGDVVVIRNVRYTIREVQQDGRGWARLALTVTT